MYSTSPHLSIEIQKKLQQAINDIKQQVSAQHVDGSVFVSGYLNSGLGANITINNLEEFTHEDIDEWRDAAFKSGAATVNYTADLGTGSVVIGVEYKRQGMPIKYCEWLKYPLILTALGAILQFL